ncbi:MAG TPA: TolC family protein [Thermoanaerobaculia bacterium]|nr:TolC family protein [Thermoanaerobaculia bacterium]
MTAVRRITTLLLLLTAAALFAQEAPAPRTTEAVTAETDRDAEDPRALRLSLDEAINTAVKQNLGVQLQTYEYHIAGQGLRSQYGLFDWIAAADVNQSSSQSPTTTTFVSSGSRVTSANGSVNQIIPTGGQYSVGFTNARVSATGGGTFVNPAYRTGLQFSFAQPLMRDFGVDITRRGITIARNNLGVTEGFFRTSLMDTVHAVEQAYLDLLYARRAVDVTKESLFLARDQARITQIRIDVGASAPLDILQPRVTIATTEEELIRRVAAVRNEEDRLRALLNLPPSEWDRPIVPSDDVSYETTMPIDLDRAVQQAMQNRPEMTQERLRLDNLRVNALYTRNQILPTVDLNLGYNLGGLAGRTLELDPDTGVPTGRVISTNYGNALSQVFGRDFPSWNAGVSFGLPVLNIGARANARAAQLDFEQAQAAQSLTQQNIVVDVRATARAVDTFSRAIIATRAARDAAERNLDAERKRYENGMTTNFQVLEVQQDLSDARVSELQAIVGYNKAVAAFHRAVGDILAVHNISVDTPEKFEEPPLRPIFGRYDWLNYGNRVKSEEQPK